MARTDASDTVARLADRRFSRMRPFGGHVLPPVNGPGLPPGPRWPAIVQTAGLLRFRHRFVPAMHRRYGDVIDRISFYAPYASDPDRWSKVLADLKAA